MRLEEPVNVTNEIDANRLVDVCSGCRIGGFRHNDGLQRVSDDRP